MPRVFQPPLLPSFVLLLRLLQHNPAQRKSPPPRDGLAPRDCHHQDLRRIPLRYCKKPRRHLSAHCRKTTKLYRPVHTSHTLPRAAIWWLVRCSGRQRPPAHAARNALPCAAPRRRQQRITAQARHTRPEWLNHASFGLKPRALDHLRPIGVFPADKGRELLERAGRGLVALHVQRFAQRRILQPLDFCLFQKQHTRPVSIYRRHYATPDCNLINRHTRLCDGGYVAGTASSGGRLSSRLRGHARPSLASRLRLLNIRRVCPKISSVLACGVILNGTCAMRVSVIWQNSSAAARRPEPKPDEAYCSVPVFRCV